MTTPSGRSVVAFTKLKEICEANFAATLIRRMPAAFRKIIGDLFAAGPTPVGLQLCRAKVEP
jgi:hypothetical protein